MMIIFNNTNSFIDEMINQLTVKITGRLIDAEDNCYMQL